MQEKKKLLGNFAGIALTTGLAIITQDSKGLIVPVINSIAGNLASSFIEKAEYSKLSSLLQDTDPSDLNHDLKKLIVKSVEWAIRNIEILYRKGLTDKNQVQELKSFTQDLLKEVKVLNNALSERPDSIYQMIEKTKDQDAVFKLFDLELANFPMLDPNRPYPEFFKEQFVPNLQLCFGELLKKESNRPAYIAYQREVYKNIDGGINQLIAQNNQILAKLDNQKEQEKLNNINQNWTDIQYQIKSTKATEISPAFEASFKNQFALVAQKTDLLLEKTTEIKDDLRYVKGVSKSFSKELKQNWLEKNKLWIMALFTVSALVIAGLIYKNITAPFSANISVKQDKTINIHSSYPKLSKDARLRFYLPNENKEKELSSSNELLINDLSHELNGNKFKVELLDKYWQLSSDSILLKPGALQLAIRPNESLSEIKGRVLSRDGQTLINEATIRMEKIISQTDKTGNFLMKIPIEQRRMQYILRVEKQGYQSAELEYFAGAAIEIRLEK